MKYNIIVAICNKHGIGMNNKLPWHISSDLKRFSKLTKGNGNNAIVMGKNTWNSLPKKPLPKRDNLILSTTLQINETDKNNNKIKTFSNLNDLYSFCNNNKYDTVWFIGGEQIYKTVINMDIINNIFITEIDKDFTCDTFFPKLPDDYLIIKNEKIWEHKYNTYYYYKQFKKIKKGDICFYTSKKLNNDKLCIIQHINKTKTPYIYTIEIGSQKYNVLKKNLMDYN